MEPLCLIVEKEENEDILMAVVGLNKKLIGQNETPVIEVMFTFLNGENAGNIKSDNLWLTEKSAWRIQALMKGCGVPKNLRDSFDFDKFISQTDTDQVIYLESLLLRTMFTPVFETREYNGKEYENFKYFNFTSASITDEQERILERVVNNYDKIIEGSINKGAKYTTATRGSVNAASNTGNNDGEVPDSVDELPF